MNLQLLEMKHVVYSEKIINGICFDDCCMVYYTAEDDQC